MNASCSIMNFKSKIVLLDKIVPSTLHRNTTRSQLFSCIHNVKVCVMNISNKSFGSLEYRQQSDKLIYNNPDLHCSMDRKTFIDSVLHKITSNVQRTQIKPKNIVIDFSSPNIAKPFHVGHLRSTIIGNFIANINMYYNNNVTKINYLGDWGTQFGLLQCGLEEKNVNVNDLKVNPLQKLYEAYVHANKLATIDEQIHLKARKYFADIEQGKESLKNWKKIREITVQELDKIYQRLGIYFDAYNWESDYNGEAIRGIINLLEERNIIATDNTGKKVAKIDNRNVTVCKSDNSTLYLSRDIAALLDKYEKYKFDEMLYVVDNSQTDHFTAVFKIVKQIDDKITNGCKHIKFGKIKGMSTRQGNVVFLNDILDEAKQKMHEKQQQSKNTRSSAMNEDTCDILGITAVLINDLKQKRQKDYIFDWDKALQSEGDSGIKLQYLHCRLWSLEQNCGVSLPDVYQPEYIPEEIIGKVITELARFEDVLTRASIEYEACIIVNYLFRLARHVNRMFNELKVKNVEDVVASQRLLIFHSARLVIRTGLEILGVKPLYEM